MIKYLEALAIFCAFELLLLAPVIYIWCIKPGKSLEEGLRDWIKESEDDF